MFNEITKIVKKADQIYSSINTRDPHRIAHELGIEILEYPFKTQYGAYKVILRNRFIFLKSDLHPVMKNIVLFHEIGHDLLHRNEAVRVGGFNEFDIFGKQNVHMEYEANVIAAQLALPDEEFLEYCKQGYNTMQIAKAMNSDVNLIALKANILIAQGYLLKKQEYNMSFLKSGKSLMS